METIAFKLQGVDLIYDLQTLQFHNKCDTALALKFLKSVFRHKSRYKELFHNRIIESLQLFHKDITVNVAQLERMLENFESAVPLTIKEVFEISEDSLRRLFFSQINVSEMVAEFGSTRVDVKGLNIDRNTYNIDGEINGNKNYDVIYELHKVDGSKLGVTDELFMVKCWCTSTNKEHYIWIETEYATDALTAIASTCRVESNVIPFIKNIKRQGDVFIFELSEHVEPAGEKVPLTSEFFFKKLIAES